MKLTQKVSADRPGHVQGLITNTYLSLAEYDLLAWLAEYGINPVPTAPHGE